MKIYGLTLPFALMAGLTGSATALAQPPATVLVLEQGSRSGIETQRFDTIRDRDALRALWQAHGKGLSPPPPLPEVDFSKDMLVAAFAGQKSTGGYQLNLVGYELGKKQIDISLSLTQPGSDCIVPQTLTQPYVIVKTHRSNKPVNFRLAAKAFSCVKGTQE